MTTIDHGVSAEARAARLKAIGLMCLALACFSGLDTTAKWLVRQGIPPLEVTFVRYLGALVASAAMFNPLTTGDAWGTRRPWLQTLRGLFLFGSTFFNFMALTRLQLAVTMSIGFAAPFLIAVLAGPILGEWIGPRRWAAILVGFTGILVVAWPGSATFDPYMTWCIGSVICYAGYAITTRMLTGIDSTASMLIISSLIPVLLLAPAMPMLWVTPQDGFTLLLVSTIGLYGAIGHYFLIRAYEFAPAPVVAPFTYTQIIWMVILGFLVFGDVPGANTLIGAGIVILSGLYLLVRERQVKGRVTAPPASAGE